MLSLLTRRVALSPRASTVTYTRILQLSTSTLRSRKVSGNCPHINTAQSFANSRRNASTEAVTKTTKAKSPTTGRKKPGRKLTPEQKATQKEELQVKKELDKKKRAEKAAVLRAKNKAQLERKKAAAALQRKRLVEKNKKLAEKAKAEKEKAKIIKPPPRGFTAFGLFVQESGKSAVRVTSDWHSLPEEKKQEYAARAKVIHEKRKEEFNTFLKSVTPLDIKRYNRYQKSRGGKRILFKSESDNSRPEHIWISFMKEFRVRPDQAGKSIIETAKAGGEAWRSLTREEKDKYKPAPRGSPTA